MVFWLCLLITLPGSGTDFQLPGLEGNPVKLSDYRGKWVIVNFWASWCAPCVKELPELSAFQASRPQDVQIIGINYEDRPPQEIKAFLSKLSATNFPHLIYKGNEAGLPAGFFIDWQGRQLALQALPTTFFIDPQGRMRGMHLGPMTSDSLDSKLLSLSGSNTPRETVR